MKASPIYIGIDPGQTGAVAFIYDGNVTTHFVMPIAGREIDTVRLSDYIYAAIEPYDTVIACVEKVSSMHGQGVVSTFKFGVNVGVIYGALGSLHIPYHLVKPQKWKSVVLEGTKKDKQAAVDFCVQVYPEVNLLATPRSKKPHIGIADAICIARYAWQTIK